MRSIIPGIVLLCVSTAGAAAQVSDVKTIPDLWLEAYHKGDAAALATLYAPDAVMVGASGQRSEGQSAIATSFERAIAATKSRKLTMKDKKLREFGEFAIQNDAWEVELVSQDDKTSTVSGRSSVVYRRGPNGWSIIDHHTAVTPR